jgi:peptidase E
MNQRKPIFLLAGGNWKNPAALIPMLQEVWTASGKTNPRVVYIGTASGDDPGFIKWLAKLFQAAGAAEVTPVFLAREQADVKQAKALLRQGDAVFVSGGDVDEGMRWLKHHRLVPFLRKLHADGRLFFGISAGAIMLGQQWVRWQDPKDDASAELFSCLGIAPVVCDTHAESDDWEELRTAVLLLGPGGLGYGIPTGGVIRVEPEGKLRAQEKPAVCFINQGRRVVRSKPLSVA